MTRANCPASWGLTLLAGLSLPARAAVSSQDTCPIRLPLAFIQSHPVTTIAVGGQTLQAFIDTGGDADAALTLSREVIDSAGAVSLGTAVVSNDASGHEFTRPRFRLPVVTLGGHTFHGLTAVQAPVRAAGEGPPVPNGIGRLFLSHYFAVVDYSGGSMTLWPPGTKNPGGTDCGPTRIPMERTKEKALAVSGFETPSGRLRLLWDTGATYSVLPESLDEKLGLATTIHGPKSPKFYEAQKLSAGGRDFGPVEFVVLPLKLPPDFEGMLGRNFFQAHVVCLDYKRRELRVR